MTWPYRDENGRVYTAETMMDLPLFNAPGPEVTTLNRVRAIAERYGVGFMVNEFGIFGEYRFGGFSRYRYTDETIYGCYTDMITLFGKEGIGWVNGCFNETWGIVQVCPVLEDVEYQKVGYYYVDTKMQAFFRKMCEGTE